VPDDGASGWIRKPNRIGASSLGIGTFPRDCSAYVAKWERAALAAYRDGPSGSDGLLWRDKRGKAWRSLYQGANMRRHARRGELISYRTHCIRYFLARDAGRPAAGGIAIRLHKPCLQFGVGGAGGSNGGAPVEMRGYRRRIVKAITWWDKAGNRGFARAWYCAEGEDTRFCNVSGWSQ